MSRIKPACDVCVLAFLIIATLKKLVNLYFLRFVVTRWCSKRRFFCFLFFFWNALPEMRPLSPLTRPQPPFAHFKKSMKKLDPSQLLRQLPFAACPTFRFSALYFHFCFACINRANSYRWHELFKSCYDYLVNFNRYLPIRMAYTVPRSVGARNSRRTRTELRFAAVRTQSALSYERVIWCSSFKVGLMLGLVIIIAPARSESFFLRIKSTWKRCARSGFSANITAVLK